MMTFANPIGLLGLLALPAILALHFFRSERRELIVGGVHLWDFTHKRQPVGRRRRRIEASVPLALELLAAFLLTMLLAGAEIPWDAVTRHYVVVIDGSASMTGENRSGNVARSVSTAIAKGAFNDDSANTPYGETLRSIFDRMTDRTRWTIVEAGLEPHLLAGPNAERDDAETALRSWRPAAPAADLPRAISLARKFARPTQPVLVFTDAPPENLREIELEYSPYLALGDPMPNAAIVFADRFRLEAAGDGSKRDRLFLVLERIAPADVSSSEGESVLTVGIDGQTIARHDITLENGEPRRLEIDIAQTDKPVVVRLNDARGDASRDALEIDNTVILAPIVGREQAVYARLSRPAERAVFKASDAAPGCRRAAIDAEATIYFEQSDRWASRGFAEVVGAAHPRARVIVLFPETDEDDEILLADREIVPIGRDADGLLEGVGFEGVLWTHTPLVQNMADGDDGATDALDLAPAILAHKREPLIVRHRMAGDQLAVGVNLAFDVGNMERSPAWPLLIYNLVEAARSRIPGPRQSNVRVGESVEVRAGAFADRPWRLVELSSASRDADASSETPYREFDSLPPRLAELPAGYYGLIAEKGPEDSELTAGLLPEYSFAVNFMSRGESDLTGRGRTDEVAARKAWRWAGAPETLQTNRGRLAYYILFFLLVATLAGLWRWQETRQ